MTRNHGVPMHRRRAYAGSGRRFAAVPVEPDRVRQLAEDHPAVVEARTLFPSTVVSALDSPRILVSGRNSPKLGDRIRKGPWRGMPVFQVTLEERATCPRSCPVWRSCYGDAMHLARRHDAADPDFGVALWAEVVSTYRAVMNERDPPPGMVVRLHVLGDFPSARYVGIWADLLDKLPGLHVFGYSARRPDADDDASRDTARALIELTDRSWDRFAIRWSRADAVPQGAVVVDSPAEAETLGAIVCPAQTGATDSCSTCGLCWAKASRDKAIAFLRHGRKPPGPGKPYTGKPRGRPRKVAPVVKIGDLEAIDPDWDGIEPGAPGSPEWWARQGL